MFEKKHEEENTWTQKTGINRMMEDIT